MVVSKAGRVSRAAAAFAAFAAATPAGRFAAMPPALSQAPKYDGLTAYSPLPPLTGQASAPITIPVSPSSNTVADTASPDVQTSGFHFTITGQDMDTWRKPDKSTVSLSDARLACFKSTEQFPTSGPTLRGTNDDVATWDLAASGAFADATVPKGKTEFKPTEIYINQYIVCNTAGRKNPKQDDAPLLIQQTIIYPGHKVVGNGTIHPMLFGRAAKAIAATPKTQIARYSETGVSAPDFIGKRIGPSNELRRDMEKRLTKKQKAGLQNGEYIAFTLGSLPRICGKKHGNISACARPSATLPVQWMQ